MKLKIVWYGGFLITMLITSCRTDSNQTKRPNILFVVSDDQSYLHTSFVGCKFINTPAFDKIASEGIYFTNCYATSPGCAPSRGSIVTGRYPWQNEQSGQHNSSWLNKYVPFLDEIEANGYVTGRTGKGVDPFQYARSSADSQWRSENAAGKAYNSIKYEEKSDDRFALGISNINYSENFKYFIDNVKEDKPFFFWFGAREPHRSYEKGSWKRRGKNLKDVDVPKFLPDNEEIRGDLLDYAVEIEWFDLELQKILEYLQEIGELDNTVIIVTSDNGMPFPRAKANCYDIGVHVPLAIRYPKTIQAGRIYNTPISLVDMAPTILELSNTKQSNMMPITGKSLWGLLTAHNESVRYNSPVFSGRERHASSRYLNQGYPQRCVRKNNYLFIWNITPERWPAGAPQKMDDNDTTKLLPPYGLDEAGKYLYRGIFADIDESPSKTYLIENYSSEETETYFNLACKKRPEFELYNLDLDTACINNLAGLEDYHAIELEMKNILMEELNRTNDPRIVGPDYSIFDSYPRYSKTGTFPSPTNDFKDSIK
ncbi:MAG: sulfatase [Flavobacteriaceae bacterium]|nr:sulfatase [Flavobacteriaceae bacterium]